MNCEVSNGDSSLPEGWAEAVVADVILNVQAGFASGAKDVENGLSHLRMNNIREDGELNLDLLRTVPPQLARPQHMLQVGDVLVCTTNSGKLVGKCALFALGGRYAFSNHLTCLRPDPAALDPCFLRWGLWLLWQSGEYEESCRNWVNQSTLPKEALLGSALWLPPLAEQKRIVAKVEELLGRVKIVRERLAKVPVILKRFRQAVLAAACSGRLTEDWRDGQKRVESAADLLARLAQERRTRWEARNPKRKYCPPENVEVEELPDIPGAWEWTNFDQCTWEITVGHVGPMKERYVEDGIPFLRCQNVRPLRFDQKGLVFIAPDFNTMLRKSALHGGEILVTRSGANTGDCCVFPTTNGRANCSDLVIARPLSGLVAEYGAIYINTPDGQARIGSRETGMAQPHFNIGAMRVKPFPLPPLAEQKEIVRRVEALFKLADTIEKRVAAATARADKLTQSILAKAFRGELVPTEAELARAEGRDYESAAVLLERVRKEREKSVEAGGKRRKASVRSKRGR